MQKKKNYNILSNLIFNYWKMKLVILNFTDQITNVLFSFMKFLCYSMEISLNS